MGAPFTGKYRKASVIDDFFCDSMTQPWQEVHRVFFDASITEGNDPYHAKMMFGAVYAWGPRWVYVDGVPMKIREAMLEPTERELITLSDWIKSEDPSLETIVAFTKKRFPRRS